MIVLSALNYAWIIVTQKVCIGPLDSPLRCLMDINFVAKMLKILDWPGIKPGTICNLDWMLYH